MCPLRGAPTPEGITVCVFAAENGNYSWRPLEAECPSIPTSTGHQGGFLGNTESAESAGIFAIFGKFLRGLRQFDKADFTSFLITFPLMGERGGGAPPQEGISACAVAAEKRYFPPVDS